MSDPFPEHRDAFAAPIRGARLEAAKTWVAWESGTVVLLRDRYDMPCPARHAFAPRPAWRDTDFPLVERASQAATEPGILDRVIRAIDRFAA